MCIKLVNCWDYTETHGQENIKKKKTAASITFMVCTEKKLFTFMRNLCEIPSFVLLIRVLKKDEGVWEKFSSVEAMVKSQLCYWYIHDLYISAAAVQVKTRPTENWKITIPGTVISDSIK